MQRKSTATKPKTKRDRSHEQALTVWLPAALVARLDATVEAQQAHLDATQPGARITRHAVILGLLSRAVGGLK